MTSAAHAPVRVISDVRLRWVLADPARERAVDALGMGAQADQIADRLVPQLSVITTRARYFSFLCWAVQKSDTNPAPVTVAAIHRLEAGLALEEARCHRDESADACPGIVGRLNATRYLLGHNWKDPSRPERLYKNTAFATYRPAMRALGMLTRSRRPELTEAGKELADAFEKARGRSPRCLSDISIREQGLLKGLLGLDYRNTSLEGAAARRRATFEAVGEVFRGDGTATDVLEQHEHLGRHPNAVAVVLHRAYVWELLSLGLALAFAMLLVEHRKESVARRLRHALAGRPRRPALGPFPGGDPTAAEHVVGLLRAALSLRSAQRSLEPAPFQLARCLIGDRRPDTFLAQIVARHHQTKPDAPWIALAGDKVQVLAQQKSLPLVVRPRTYRLDAYGQILRDVGMIPS